MTENTQILRINPLFLFEDAYTPQEFKSAIEQTVREYSEGPLFRNIEKTGNEYRVYLRRKPNDKQDLISYIENELPVDYAYWEF